MKTTQNIVRLIIFGIISICSIAATAQGVGIPAKNWGIGFGNSATFAGLRFNAVDHNIDKIKGVNFTSWYPKPFEDQSGSFYGLGIGVPLAIGTENRFGASIGILGVAATEKVYGLNIGGLAVGGDKVAGLNVGGFAVGGGEFAKGINIGGLAVGAGESVAGFNFGGLAVGAVDHFPDPLLSVQIGRHHLVGLQRDSCRLVGRIHHALALRSTLVSEFRPLGNQHAGIVSDPSDQPEYRAAGL